MLILFGMIDLGRWVFLAMEVSSAAHAGAQYGSLNQGNAHNAAGIQTAAQADVPDIPSLTVTSSTSSCWCADAPGTVVSCGVYPSNPCSSSQIVLVQVNTQATFNSWIPYPKLLLPTSMTINGHATMPTGQY